MTTPDLASICDEQEAEIGRLVAELAVVRRDWQADVGTLTANLNTAEARVVRAKLEYLEALERAQTAEARAARLNTEIAYLIEDNEEMGRREMLRAASARKVAKYAAQTTASMGAMEEQVNDARAASARMRAERDVAFRRIAQHRAAARNVATSHRELWALYKDACNENGKSIKYNFEMGKQRDAARAEVMALLAHMIAHNVELQDTCEKQKRSGECSNVGMCDSCPRQWMIDALRESNDGD